MFQEEQVSIVIVVILLAILFYFLHRDVEKLKNKEKPSRLATATIKYVKFIYNYTLDSMGPDYGPKFAAYIGSVFIYLLLSNFSGLLGLSAPTTNFSVTLTLAAITWISIQVVKLRTNGLGGYFKSFADPFVFFIIPNIFGEIAPLISLSLRLFGNLISGAFIMSLFYMFTGWVMSKIPLFGHLNLLGSLTAPPLHMYFDLFSGFLQAFIFVSLSMILIGAEAPSFTKEESEKKKIKIF